MFCFKLSPVNDVFTKEKQKHKPLQELSLPTCMFGFWSDVHVYTRHMIIIFRKYRPV